LAACGTDATATTTATTGGNIGIMISGPALFNAAEGQLNGPAALIAAIAWHLPATAYGAGGMASASRRC
jgi:hypothetical protein